MGSKKKAEIDEEAIRHNLSLSVQERLERHQAALETIIELKKAHKKIYAKPKSNSESTY